MLKAYFEMFENDRDFRSRTGRQAFWRAAIPDMIIWAVLILCYFLFPEINLLYVVLAAAYLVLTLTARLALWVRRMHDTGIKGTFAFVIFVPVLGLLALWFVFMYDSQAKDNIYGKYVPEPKKKRKKK